jgi:hypothetical protein
MNYKNNKETMVLTDKKENKIFLLYKENSDGIGCKVIYEERLPNI